MTPSHSSNPQLDEANKYIFVKAYERAERMIEDLVNSDAYRNDLLLHLRRVELATKLDTLAHLRKVYEEALEKDSESITYRIGLIFVEQHGEFIENKEAMIRLQALLRTV